MAEELNFEDRYLIIMQSVPVVIQETINSFGLIIYYIVEQKYCYYSFVRNN